jgi:hypothetical protein
MMTFLLPVLSAAVCAGIDALRIKLSYGKVANINKIWTYTFGILFYGLCLALSVNYYDHVTIFAAAFYGIYFIGCRGVFYDPLLNGLRGLPIDYISSNTNSILDQIFYAKVNFYDLRILYFIITLIGGFGWQQLYLNMI